jgi:isopenicillin N synthase-like dioxygenase
MPQAPTAAGGISAAAAAQGADVGGDVQLSCGSHTDYGLLTLVLQQPGVSALQVSPSCPLHSTRSTKHVQLRGPVEGRGANIQDH